MNGLRFWCAMAAFVAAAAHAICPHPTPKVCAMFFESDAVFLGKVTAKNNVVEANGDVDRLRYTIDVKEVYRGHPKGLEHVTTENASARWIADVGRTYLVFASRGDVGATCGPLDQPEYAREAIRKIRALRNASHATIEGEVLHQGANGAIQNALEGIRVKVSGPNGEYESVTDRKGQFSFTLSPGRYRIDPTNLQPTLYSRQDLDNIDLVKGQCAQYELTAR